MPEIVLAWLRQAAALVAFVAGIVIAAFLVAELVLRVVGGIGEWIIDREIARDDDRHPHHG